MTDPQQETLDFLARRLGATRLIATHISHVLIGPDRVYKLKRAVRLPYLDFSTPDLRLRMCLREIALNRRFSAALYLGVRRVTRQATREATHADEGALALDGDGALVDAVVEMRRFDDDALFEDRARKGRLDRETIGRLARRVAQAHDAAVPDKSRGGADSMGQIIDSMSASLRQAPPANGAEIDAHIAALRETLSAWGARIDARRAEGRVRPCHGDLNLRNICLFEGEPTPFDCIEFSDEISTIDVLYDIAFLLMDLWRTGLSDLAGVAFNRYLDARREDESDGLALLPFFMSLRATIRAHVEAAQGHDETARVFFDLSRALLRDGAGAVIAIGGFSGSGKSSVAAALAPLVSPAPGARVFNSDRIRKRLFGAEPAERLPPEAYASDISAKVYGEMFAAAARAAQAGWPVIVDAVFDRPQDRAAIEAAARASGVPFFGVWLDLDLAQRLSRVERRVDDVSDATTDVLKAQMAKETGDIAWRRIDAGRDVRMMATEISAALPAGLRGG